MKKKFTIIACCFLMLLVTACGNNPKLENGEEVIASIDGKEFTADDLYAELKSSYGYDSLLSGLAAGPMGFGCITAVFFTTITLQSLCASTTDEAHARTVSEGA